MRTATFTAMIAGRRNVCVQHAKKPGFASGIRRQDQTQCQNSKKTCQRLLQFGWCTDCESKQKVFLERLAQRYPEEYQLPMLDPPHNIKSVRSSLFWYWLFLDDYLINIRMLPIMRRDQDNNIARPMKQAVTMKALKNMDRMSVETALEVM